MDTSPELPTAEGTRASESAGTSISIPASPSEDATKQFVESFFSDDKLTQRQYLSALLADPRARDVLPANFGRLENSQNNPQGMQYNNQSIDISDPSNYRPIDNTAFHWYTPEYLDGRLRNLDEQNNPRPNFDLARAANKSCLLYANKIQDFVMGLTLSDEQRRSAFWKALCLPKLSGMVKSYGLPPKRMNIGLLVAENLRRLID